MFDSPILDVCIGLIFILLLHSLLATSMSEGIATLFALRARTLRKGIIKGMLSNTLTQNTSTVLWLKNHTVYMKDRFNEAYKENTWWSIFKAFRNLFYAIWRIMTGTPYEYKEGTPGGDFYLHPIIKSYGSSRRYSVPSYIPPATFYTVFTDVLEQYFLKNIKAIADANKLTVEEAINLPQITKLDYLIKYIAQEDNKIENVIIDPDTLKIIHVYLKESYHNPVVFSKKIEEWFNTTMDRVSGWYKRQIQYMLFVLGLVLAITFNVDLIEIANRLSEDKDARDKLVEMAIKAPEQYKNDPRVQQLQLIIASDTTKNTKDAAKADLKKIQENYAISMDKAKKMLEGDIKEANNLLSLGWGDYGKKDDSLSYIGTYKKSFDHYKTEIKKQDSIHYIKRCKILEDSIAIALKLPDSTYMHKEVDKLMDKMLLEDKMLADTISLNKRAFVKMYESKSGRIKTKYVFNQLSVKNMTGFLLFAFGVCLGAPFWFDLLQKVVKLRASGKRENTTNTTQPPAGTNPAAIHVNVKSTNAEEAAG